MGPHLMLHRLRSTFAPGFMSMAAALTQCMVARSTSRNFVDQRVYQQPIGKKPIAYHV